MSGFSLPRKWPTLRQAQGRLCAADAAPLGTTRYGQHGKNAGVPRLRPFGPSLGMTPFMRGPQSRSFERAAVEERLFHSLAWVPGALFFADEDDLADVVGVVGADVGDERGFFGDGGVVGCLD